MSDIDEIKRTARLARLAIDQSELPELLKNFNKIMDFFAVLDEVHTEDLKEFSHYPDSGNVLRADFVGQSLGTDQALNNAPDSQNDFFKTPLIVGSE